MRHKLFAAGMLALAFATSGEAKAGRVCPFMSDEDCYRTVYASGVHQVIRSWYRGAGMKGAVPFLAKDSAETIIRAAEKERERLERQCVLQREAPVFAFRG